MQGKNYFPQDEAGNLLTEGSVVVRHSATQALALIYASDDTNDPLDNPFDIPDDGHVLIFAHDGDYDIAFERGVFSRTLPFERFGGGSFGAEAARTVIANNTGSLAIPEAVAFSELGFNGYRPQNNFWANDTPAAWVERIPDRLLVGYATDTNAGSAANDGPSAPYFTGLPSSIASGASYVIRDAQVGVVSRNGLIAIGAITRASDYAGSRPANFRDPIALAGYTINDVTGTTVQAWGGYLEVQRESGAGGVLGLEIAVKNKGSNVIPTPYGTGTNAAHGLWLAGGSDDAYGGSPANPSTSGIVFIQNSHTWNTGITFASDALTDRGSGVYNAIDLAKGHSLTWFQQGVEAFALRSVGDTPGQYQRMIVDVRKVSFFGNDNKEFFVMNSLNSTNTDRLEVTSSNAALPILSAAGTSTNVGISYETKGTGAHYFKTGGGTQLSIANTASAVNNWSLQGAAAGGGPTLKVEGSDTNISMLLSTKGSGTTFFYSDGFGAAQFSISRTGSAVNRLNVTGNATGGSPILSATGSDTNIDVITRGQGSGGGRLQDGGSANKFQWNTTGIAFFAGTPAAKQSITGSRTTGAALASLLTALDASYGLITDSSTA